MNNNDDNRMEELVSERLRYMVTGDEQVLWTGKTESYAKLKRKNIFIAVMIPIMALLLFQIIKYIIISPIFVIFAISPAIILFVLAVLFRAFIKQSK